MPNRGLKYFLSLLFLLFSVAGFSQIPVNRAPASVMVIDQRLHAQLQFGLPIYPDTTTANANLGGLDSLGLVIVIRANPVVEYIRDSSAGTHKWSLWTGTGGGGAVSSVFGRTGAVTATIGDYTAAQVLNAVDQTGSYFNPAWITGLAASKITGPGNLTAGSTKVSIGGSAAGVGALLVAASVDVVPANVLLSTLGGQLNISQINASGATNSTTALFGDGTWKSVVAGQSAIQFHDAVNGNLNTSGATITFNFIKSLQGDASGGNIVNAHFKNDTTFTAGAPSYYYGYDSARGDVGWKKPLVYFWSGLSVRGPNGDSISLGSKSTDPFEATIKYNTYLSGSNTYSIFWDSLYFNFTGPRTMDIISNVGGPSGTSQQFGYEIACGGNVTNANFYPLLFALNSSEAVQVRMLNAATTYPSTNGDNGAVGIVMQSSSTMRHGDEYITFSGTPNAQFGIGATDRFLSGKRVFAIVKTNVNSQLHNSFNGSTIYFAIDSAGLVDMPVIISRSTDTTNLKPVVVDANGYLYKMFWNGGGGGGSLTMGTWNNPGPSATGAVISSGVLYMTAASLSNPGEMSASNYTDLEQTLAPSTAGSARNYFIFTAGPGSTITSANNYGLGYQSSSVLTSSASDDIGLGHGTNFSLTTGSDDVSIGEGAGQTQVADNKNIWIGTDAGQNANQGSDQIGIGYTAGKASRSTGNIFIGRSAGVSYTNYNGTGGAIMLGQYAGQLDTNTNGAILIGVNAGTSEVNGTALVMIGQNAGKAVTGSGLVIIGDNAESTASDNIANSVIIGTSAGDVGGNNLTNDLLIGHSVQTSLSNVGGIGRYDQDIIIGVPNVSGNPTISTDPGMAVQINQGVGYTYTSISANTTLDRTYHYVNATAAITITLPTASGVKGQEYNILNSSSGSVTISTYTLIGQTTSTTIATHTSLHILSTGSVWQQY